MSHDTSINTTPLIKPPKNSFDRRKALASFLKSKRAKTSPSSQGFKVNSRRRVAGLTREEVAISSGISLTWYTWLEQARNVNPSVKAIESLAKTLQLNSTERNYLYKLTQEKPVHSLSAREKQVPDELNIFLSQLDPKPAYIFNSAWEVLAWNKAAQAIFGSFFYDGSYSNNLLYKLLIDSSWRELFYDWEDICQAAVEQFRASIISATQDTYIESLIEELKEKSLEFNQYWDSHIVSPSPLRQKNINHPDIGSLLLNYVSLKPTGDHTDLTITIYTANSKEDKMKINSILPQSSNPSLGPKNQN